MTEMFGNKDASNSIRCLLQLSGLLLGFLISTDLLAQSAIPLNSDHQLTYRRLFVPAESPETWPIESSRFLSINKSRLERLLKYAQKRSESHTPTVTCIATLFHAKLVSGSLLGTTDFLIEMGQETPQVLPISPWNLSIASAHWKADPSQPAQLGSWTIEEGQTPLGVLVRKSGCLTVDWSLAPESTSQNQLDFRFRIPVSSARSFSLVVPAQAIIDIKSGLISHVELINNVEKRVDIVLHPTDSHRLRVRLPLDSDLSVRQSRISQSISYEVDSKGLTTYSNFRLDRSDRNIKTLQLVVPKETHVISARIDNTNVDWSMNLETPEHPILEVPLASTDQPQNIELKSYSPSRIDEPWKLPRILAKNVEWIEGSTTLEVDSTLDVQSISPVFSSLHHSVGIGKEEGEVFRFHDWSKDASIELRVTPSQPRLQVEYITSMDWDTDEFKSNLHAILSSEKGRVYQLEALIESEWKIEKVTSKPKSALQDWTVYEKQNQRFLRLHFEEPIAKGSPVDLEILARSPSKLIHTRRKLSSLKVLGFLNTAVSNQFLHLSSRQSQSKSLLLGGGATRIAIEDVPLALATRLPKRRRALLIDLAKTPHEAFIQLQSESTTYDAHIHIHESLLATTINYDYAIQCNPLSGAVSEIILESESPLPSDLAWKIEDQEVLFTGETISPITETESESERSSYLLRLPRAFDSPFILTANYTAARKSTSVCNFIQVPSAQVWRGIIDIHGARSDTRILDDEWDQAISILNEHTDSHSLPILASYRFGAEELRSNSPLVVQTRRDQKPTLPALNDSVCPIVHYKSWHSIDGNSAYQANYLLENVGSNQATLLLPTGATIIEASINDNYLAPEEILLDKQLCTFLLPRLHGMHEFSVRYSIQASGFGLPTSIKPEFPKSSFPIAESTWTLALPRQFQLESESYQKIRKTNTLWHRLFYPISQDLRNSSNIFLTSRWKDSLSEFLDSEQIELSGASEQIDNVFEDEVRSALKSNSNSRTHGSRTNQDAKPSFLSSYRTHRLEFVKTPPVVRVFNRYSKEARQKLTFALALISGILIYAYTSKGALYASSASLILCLLAPLAWLSYAQSIFLGLLSSLLYQLLHKAWSTSQKTTSTIRVSSESSLHLMLVFLTYCSLTAVCSAEDSGVENTQANPNREASLILIPVNQEGEIVSDERFIQEDFLVGLQTLEENRHRINAHYVLSKLIIRGDLNQILVTKPSSTKLPKTNSTWKLHVFVETFRDGTILELPLHRESANWLLEALRIDGLPATCQWSHDGTMCRLAPMSAGKHQIELSFQPLVQSKSERIVLQLKLPPCPRRELDLAVNDELIDLNVTGTTLKNEGDSGRWNALLPPGEDLEISWLPKSNSIQENWQGTIEQYSWLKVEPATTQLQVLFHLQSDSSFPQSLVLTKPKNLKLVSTPSEAGLTSILEISRDTVHLELEERLLSEHKISLTFELQRSLSLGQILFPGVRLLNLPTNRKIFAVSVDSHLSYDEVTDEPMRSYPPENFAIDWGSDVHPPLYSYLLDKEAPQWSLRIWPTPRTYSAQQTQRVHLGLRQSTFKYEAEIDQIRGDILVHRLGVEKGLEITSVLLSTPNSPDQIPIRWNRVNPEVLVVFLGQPLGKKHLLTVKGRMIPDSNGNQDLPIVSLIGAERNMVRAILVRKNDVRVSWTDPMKKPDEFTQQSMLRNSSEILVGQYSWKPLEKHTYSSLQVQKNEAGYDAITCITMFKQNDERWEASLNARITAKRGLLDQVEVSLPDHFRGPYRLTPENSGLVLEQGKPDSSNSTCILLSKPLREGETVDLKFTGFLDLESSQHLVAPNLHLLGAESVSPYIVLPTSDSATNISWNRTTGLRRQTLPSEVQDLVGSHAGHLSYRIQQKNFLAHQRLQRGALRKAGLRYCAIDALLDRENMLSANAYFVLQPGRASDCELKLPPHSELINLIVGDQHIIGELTPEGLWRIPLGPSYLPRKIHISYLTMLEPSRIRSKLRLWPPKLAVSGQTLTLDAIHWKLRYADQPLPYKALAGQEITADQLAQRLIRIDLQTIEDTKPLLSELPQFEAKSWFQHWERSIRASRSILSSDSNASLSSPPNKTSYLTTVQLVEETLSEISERFPASPPGKVNPSSRDLVARNGLPTHFRYHDNDAFYFVGTETHLDLVKDKMGPRNFWNWLLSAIVLCGLALGSKIAKPLSKLLNLVMAYPTSISIILGMIWWLCFHPSWLGLILMAVAIVNKTSNYCWQLILKKRNSASTQYPARVS